MLTFFRHKRFNLVITDSNRSESFYQKKWFILAFKFKISTTSILLNEQNACTPYCRPTVYLLNYIVLVK